MSARKPTARKPTAKRIETIIQRNIEAAIGSEPDFLLLRNSIGTAHYMSETTGKQYHVPYGLGEGSADLVGVLEPWGHFVGMEVKDPNGVVEPHQEHNHDVWRRFGVSVFVVYSVEDAVAAVHQLRREVPQRMRVLVEKHFGKAES